MIICNYRGDKHRGIEIQCVSHFLRRGVGIEQFTKKHEEREAPCSLELSHPLATLAPRSFPFDTSILITVASTSFWQGSGRSLGRGACA